MSQSPLDSVFADENIERIVTSSFDSIDKLNSLEDFKNLKNRVIGENSDIALVNRAIGKLDQSQKAEAGKKVTEARNRISQKLDKKLTELENQHQNNLLQSEAVDVTEVVAARKDAISISGSRHPLTVIAEIICDVFTSLGYSIQEGPEAEATWFNFDSLNISPSHPSRSPSDTFYLNEIYSQVVLRTQTSPVQMRAMLKQKPPLYVIAPGKVFRSDELDATHTPVFHQVEGLAVDKNLNMSHLKGTLDHLAKKLFGDGVETRFRPSFFPFTEPSAELDVRCFVCKDQKNSKNCKTCKGNGWIEWGGCGMVNPNVLETAGIDSKKFSGFAFGMGLERTLMFRHGIEDMHYLVEADLRFSSKFGMGL